MPRVIRETKFAALGRCIRGYANAPKVAEALGCTPKTARNKLNNPELFTVGDLEQIRNKLHIPIEEIRERI